jgi:hypothetical protein
MIKNATEDAGRVEMRVAESVNRAVFANQSNSSHIADDAVFSIG